MNNEIDDILKKNIKQALKKFVNKHKKGGNGTVITIDGDLVNDRFCVLDKDNFKDTKEKISEYQIQYNREELIRLFNDANANDFIDVILQANKLLIENYVSFDMFFAKIDSLIKDVKQIINTKSFENVNYDHVALVISLSTCANKSKFYEKSNYWIMLYVLSQLSDKEFDELIICTSRNYYVDKNTIYIMCDDIMYSGSQMGTSVDDFWLNARVFSTKLEPEKQITKLDLFFVMYGATDYAKKFIKDKKNTNVTNIDDLERIETSKTLMGRYLESKPEAKMAYFVESDDEVGNNIFRNKVYEYVKEMNNITFTTYFAKFPDDVSTEQTCFFDLSHAANSAAYSDIVDHKNTINASWFNNFYKDIILNWYNKSTDYYKNCYYFYMSDVITGKNDERGRYDKIETEEYNSIFDNIKQQQIEDPKIHIDNSWRIPLNRQREIKEYSKIKNPMDLNCMNKLYDFYNKNTNIKINYDRHILKHQDIYIRDNCDSFTINDSEYKKNKTPTMHILLFISNVEDYENVYCVYKSKVFMYCYENDNLVSSSVVLDHDKLYIDWTEEFIKKNPSPFNQFYCPNIKKNKIQGKLIELNKCYCTVPNNKCSGCNNSFYKRNYVVNSVVETANVIKKELNIYN